jgi:catechol 2,3-dioxygenase-like lactoylglutathione lyase family enzyme
MMPALNTIDHIAIPVTDVAASVTWYREHFQCQVTYQDDSWALLAFANIQLALVIPAQHPAHIGFVTAEAEKFGALKKHRDGTRSCYVNDPSGNSIEMLAADSMPDYK